MTDAQFTPFDKGYLTQLRETIVQDTMSSLSDLHFLYDIDKFCWISGSTVSDFIHLKKSYVVELFIEDLHNIHKPFYHFLSDKCVAAISPYLEDYRVYHYTEKINFRIYLLPTSFLKFQELSFPYVHMMPYIPLGKNQLYISKQQYDAIIEHTLIDRPQCPPTVNQKNTWINKGYNYA